MLAVVVTVAENDVEIAADELWALGVVAIEERRTGAVHGDGSAEIELWTSLGDDADAITPELSQLGYRWRLEPVDTTVSETWRQFARPTWVESDLVVVPAWIRQEERGDVDAPGVTSIEIEPGATFGLGDHPTTVSSMRALRGVVRPGDDVLDVGCGSGVLAIAACLFGAASATGIDIAPAAVGTTNANAVRNGVHDRVTVSTTSLAAVSGTFDVVVANILAPVLIDLSSDLRRVLADTGSLVISGILADAHDHVLAALSPLVQVDRIDVDGWTAITLRR